MIFAALFRYPLSGTDDGAWRELPAAVQRTRPATSPAHKTAGTGPMGPVPAALVASLWRYFLVLTGTSLTFVLCLPRPKTKATAMPASQKSLAIGTPLGVGRIPSDSVSPGVFR